MGKFIALLRGINVGGNNKVPMPELKELFEQNGFKDVITYINSGNIIFSSDNADEKKLREECEVLIASKFHLNIPVTIVSIGDLMAALEHAPSWWGRDKDSKHTAIFVIPPVTVDEVFEEVGMIKPEYEKVDHFGRAFFGRRQSKLFQEHGGRR